MKVVWIAPLFPVNENVMGKIIFINNVFPNIICPWLPALAKEISKIRDIELHIICSHGNIRKDVSVMDKGIHYYYINQTLPFVKRKYPHFLKNYTNYLIFRNKVKKLVKKIDPDIVNLHGTEHDLSLSIIDIKYPKLVTIQGLIHSVYKRNPTKYNKHLLNNEMKIFKQCNDFGIRAAFLQKEIGKYNKKANFHWFYYPFGKEMSSIDYQNYKKENDIIFAARICKDKGIEDLIEAVWIVKKKIPTISMRIYGLITNDYKKIIMKLIEEKKLNDNVKLIGFVDDRHELKYAYLESKICVLPTYHDVVPGTIIDSLKLGIPVISYSIDGVVDFNRDEEIIKLVPKGDVIALSDKIYELLTNERKRIELGLNAQKEARIRFDDNKNAKLLVESYKKIINNRG